MTRIRKTICSTCGSYPYTVIPEIFFVIFHERFCRRLQNFTVSWCGTRPAKGRGRRVAPTGCRLYTGMPVSGLGRHGDLPLHLAVYYPYHPRGEDGGRPCRLPTMHPFAHFPQHFLNHFPISFISSFGRGRRVAPTGCRPPSALRLPFPHFFCKIPSSPHPLAPQYASVDEHTFVRYFHRFSC